ncbi:MAG TPA: redox-sensing transcriptional repressor Rex [bacterium]|nr:redox-sensing transcriptional repressor Rex [bacterium]HOL66678.1 redox-sensing transcriptional repressor Rex [bacterium]HPP11182.1 redox-sensing transcriptional repressor Rex [bacterium]
MIGYRSVILRLSHYRRCLRQFEELGYTRVFSRNLGQAAGVSAAQVRKDFSFFGLSGRRKGGYIIAELLEKINQILKKDRIEKVILVGAGHLGNALIKYKGFEKEGMQIVAAFDADPAKLGKKGEVPVYPMDELFRFVRDYGIRVAILTVPAAVAQDVGERLVSAGIRGILNFSPITLRLPERVIVSYINLAIELEHLLYYVNESQRENR